MKTITARTPALVLATALALPGAGQAQPRVGIELLPASTPAVIVVNSPGALAEALGDLMRPGGGGNAGNGPAGSAAGRLFGLLGFDGVPDGVNPEGRLTVGMPQFPFPLFVVPVSDYDLFLKSLRGGAPAAPGGAAAQLLPGIDLVSVDGKPLFVRKEGDLAMLSTMPLFLSPPAPGASLGALLTPEEREFYAGSSAFVRIDVGVIVALLEPWIQQYLDRPEVAPGNAPDGQEPAGDGDDLEARQLLRSEADFLIRGLRQVKSLSVAGTVTEKGHRYSSLYLPQTGSGFADLLQRLEAGEHGLLRFFEGDAALAGAFSLDAAALAEPVAAIMDHSLGAGVYGLSEEERRRWKSLVMESLELAGSHSAFYFGPSKTGGAFTTFLVSEVKDADRSRALMRDYLEFAGKLVPSTASEPGMRMEITHDTLQHGGTPIDHFRLLVSPAGGERDEEFEAAMKALFGGGSLDLWAAAAGNHMVFSYYTSSPEELKNLIDRLQSGGTGGLLEEPPFIEATSSLAKESLSLAFFSFPRFMGLITGMLQKIKPDSKLLLLPVTEEEMSGIGFSSSRNGGALRMDTFIPRRELENIRKVTDYLRSLNQDKQSGSL